MSRESSRLEFLGELAGGLAHEIKNPLSTMRLHLELMEEDLKEEENERARRNYNKVALLLKEVRRLEETVQEFLRFSRGHDLKLVAVDLEASLRDLMELVRPEAERKKVSLHLRVLNRLGAVLVDETYFHRALLNLVQNAVDACAPKGGGDVIVEVGRAQHAVGIAIVDTGVGIPPGVGERVFRAYFTTKQGGTGMGLPMSKRIIEEHGGYIAFDSVEGQGTRFMVMLPVSVADNLSQLAVRNHGAPLDKPEAIDVTAVVNEVLAESKSAAVAERKAEAASVKDAAKGRGKRAT